MDVHLIEIGFIRGVVFETSRPQDGCTVLIIIQASQEERLDREEMPYVLLDRPGIALPADECVPGYVLHRFPEFFWSSSQELEELLIPPDGKVKIELFL